MDAKNKYKIKIIHRDGVACISVVNTEKQYVENYSHIKDPKGEISKEYCDKPHKRFSIINKLKSIRNERKNSMAVASNE